jgi:hypothetical protein
MINEHVGLNAIAGAVGVSYHDLWLAVRTHRIVLRIDANRTGKPPVANFDEVQNIKAQLLPDITPSKKSIGASEVDVDDGMSKFITSVLNLEKRLDP